MKATRDHVDRISAAASLQSPFVLVLDNELPTVDELNTLILSAGWQPRFATSTDEVLAKPRGTTAGCALIEFDLARLSGSELQELVHKFSGMPIIFMSSRVDVKTTVRAMKAGAFGFLSKPLEADLLLDELSSAIEHSHTDLQRSSRISNLSKRYQLLSRREREVMQLVVAGRLNKQVGAQLGISEITVKAHRGRVMRKMQAASLADLVNMANDLQLTKAAAFTVHAASKEHRPCDAIHASAS
jgi:FixJ family two-component response regulator